MALYIDSAFLDDITNVAEMSASNLSYASLVFASRNQSSLL